MTAGEVMSAYDRAVFLGAVDSYDDCIGGSLRAPDGATSECVEAVAEYRRREIALHSETAGRARREYYKGK